MKDERFIDRFDRVFSEIFGGILSEGAADGVDQHAIPEDWLRKLAEKHLSNEEKKLIESLGGFDKLIETLKQRLAEQKERHQGGSKWIGTAGTSPFGALWLQSGRRAHRPGGKPPSAAVKVWDSREFRNLDDRVELGTRNIKVALRRLRRFVRERGGRGTRSRRHDPLHRRARLSGCEDTSRAA